VAGDGETFLLMGTDSRSAVSTTGQDSAAPDFVFGAQRSDAIMLATVGGDGKTASVVSIPRDSWVDVPGRGMNKINAAYSFGGPTLLIQTVEALTRVRVDHFAVIDFAGFEQMTDAVGGIDVVIPQATSDMRSDFASGPQHLDGAQALNYVRQRYNLPGGDFDRVRRQQNALRALVRQALSSGTLSSPTRAFDLVNTLTQHIGVDDSLSNTDLATLAFSLRDLRSGDVTFLTAPYLGTGTEGDQSVVYLDRTADDDLWFAVNNDSVAEWVAARPQADLPEAPR
jgi:LCP family protein required for cell wall assembly